MNTQIKGITYPLLIIVMVVGVMLIIARQGLAWTSPTGVPPTASSMITSVGGNIGIGTVTPYAKLSVSGNIIATRGTFANGLVDCTGGIVFTNATYFTCTAPYVRYPAAGVLNVYPLATGQSTFDTLNAGCLALGGSYYSANSGTPDNAGYAYFNVAANAWQFTNSVSRITVLQCRY